MNRFLFLISCVPLLLITSCSEHEHLSWFLSFETLESETELHSSLFEFNEVEILDTRARSGHKSLMLKGNDNQESFLIIKPIRTDKTATLSFWVDRWTNKNPYQFKVEILKTGEWEVIYNGDDKIKTRGWKHHVQLDLTQLEFEQLRLKALAPTGGGVLIDDLMLSYDEPMRVDGVAAVPLGLPVLKNSFQNPVKHIVIYASGSEKPLSLTQILGEEVGDVQRVNVHYGQNEPDFTKSTMLYLDHDHSPDGKLGMKQPLRPGENHFWISLDLGDSASLISETGFKIKDIVVSRAHYKQIDEAVARRGIALRRHGQDSVDTYRIPGLVTTNKGSLIAVYDIRRNGAVDLQEDVDIGMSRSTDGGETWEPMKVIMDMGEWGDLPENQNGIGDPSVLVDKQTGTIWVAAVWAHGHPGERNWWASKPGLSPTTTSQFMLAKSEDDGLSWSEPINITTQIKDPKWHLLLQGPGKGITMKDGTLVFPAQYKDEHEMPHSTIIYSRDAGKSWKIGTGAKSNTTEAQVVELTDGSLMLNMRDNRGGSRSVYTTTDMGQNWTVHPTSRTALPEPVCMASLIKHNYKGEELLLFSNPNATKGRFNMTVKLSKDMGNSWPEAHQRLLDAGRGRGYSCMTSIDEETIGILYESSQADLVFQKIKISELLN